MSDRKRPSPERVISNRQRARAFRERQAAAGLVQVVVWVFAEKAAGFVSAAEQIRANRALEVGPLRNTETGKLAKLDP